MKKYAVRTLVSVLAFLFGIGAIYFFAGDKLKDAFYFPHSAERNSPFSLLEDTTVRIKPFEASFEIPDSWLKPNPVPAPSKNLYLSYQDLNALYLNDGFDDENAHVINSVLRFEDCAAHVGDRGWGNYLWNDLQVRVYVTNLTPIQVSANIDVRGLSAASSVFERASIRMGNHNAWQKRTIDIIDAPTHFILMKKLDFYYRAYRGKTVVIVFLHAGGFEKETNLILDSFSWPDEKRQEQTLAQPDCCAGGIVRNLILGMAKAT